MDDSTTSTAEKKSLQIDTSLISATTSQLTISSTDSGLTTPANSRILTNARSSSNNEHESHDKEWKDFYDRVKQTPPKDTSKADYGKTLAMAEELLRLSDSEEFQNKSFNDLNDDQQAIMIFMILKEMHKVFGPSLKMNAKALIVALNLETKEHKQMLSFVGLGGDHNTAIGHLMELSYKSFVEKFPEWIAETATTIFKKNHNMTPFIHLQNEESLYICTYAACSALMFYSLYNNKQDVSDQNELVLKMNVSRYVQDEVSGAQIANFTLTDMKGAYLDNVLLGLIQSFGTDDCQKIEKVKMWKDNEVLNYLILEAYLQEGHPIVFSVETLPALADYEKQQYLGKVLDYYLHVCDRPDKPKKRVYHTLVCIGIKPRNCDIPPMLLVQDSSSHCRPFFSIGLDLLMDMDIENLQFYTVPKKWSFNENMDYLVKTETRSLLCGSPMWLDNNDVPHVLVAEKTKVKRPDMSRYLDIVDPNSGPLVFII